MKNIRSFYLKEIPFFVAKFSIYLNRSVFLMIKGKQGCDHMKLV